MQRICNVTGEPFIITPAESALREQLAPVIGGRRVALPAPTLSPEERQRRRLAQRNERILYRNTSAVSGKPLVSSYSADKKLSVVSRDEWLDIDNTQFGLPFDFNRTVFDQFAELSAKTYKANVIHDGEMLNSDYTHFCGWNKNCYLTFDSGKSEECAYGVLFIYSKDSYDCFYAIECELCYDCTKIHNCYQLFHSQFCQNCTFSAFLTDCIGCINCLCCANLRNKEYYAFNKYVGKEEFERLWKHYFSGSFRNLEGLAAEYEAFLRGVPKRALRNVNCGEHSGDLLTNCVDVFESFNTSGSRNCHHIHDCIEVEHSLDISMFGEGLQHCYELSGCGGARGKVAVGNCYFSSYIFYGGYNVLYSICCHQNCKDLFACTDLSRKSHCILNKQYTPSEYEALLPRVVEHMVKTGEWGEFFPLHMSPYGYNESLAQEFLPLSKEDALSIGANWSEYAAPAPAVTKAIRASELPDSLRSPDEFSLDTGIVCEATGKVFRLTKQELQFYLTHGHPLPRLHPEERQRLRSRRFNYRRLLTTRCAKTGVPILTTYLPSQSSFVVSEAAYLEDVE